MHKLDSQGPAVQMGVAQTVCECTAHKDYDHSARDAAVPALRNVLTAMDKKETAHGEHRLQPRLAKRKQTANNEESRASTARTSARSNTNKYLASHELHTYTQADNTIAALTFMFSCPVFTKET